MMQPAMLALVLATILAGCAVGPAASPTGTAPAPTASAAGSPAEAPRPSIIVRSWTCLACIYSLGTLVLDDGLVLTDDRGDEGMLARQLSPAGLAWVQKRVAGSPLADGEASYRAVPASGAPSDLREHTPHRFVVERDGARIAVESDVVGELTGDRRDWAIPDEMLALDRLSADLADIDGWVPQDLWSGAWAPYRPERYLLIVEPVRDTAPEDAPAAPDADSMPWPFLGRIDEVGTTRPGGDPTGARCLVIDDAAFASLAAAEATRGMERPSDAPYVTNVYRWARGRGELVVGTRWLLPHEPSDCRAADSDW